jgi:diguanylate cyclase (GGDEF)-like protein
MHIFITIIITFSIFILACFTPVEYNEWILYIFPLFYAYAFLKQQHLITLAVVCLILSILDLLLFPQGAITQIVIVNRSLGIITLFGTSFLFIRLRQSLERTKEMEREMRYLAHHDALTDLPNRRLFADLIRTECALARRHGKKIALLVMDLDRFKEVNDTFGHEVGDLLLKEVAARLKANVRSSDSIFRTGGDEFYIIVSDVSKEEDIRDVARKILGLFQSSFNISGHELHITASIGISIYPEDTDDMDTLRRYADITVYYAKEYGRNTFQFYNPEINKKMRLG